MIFSTPRNKNEELEMLEYMKNHPYAPFVHPTENEIAEAKELLQTIRTAKLRNK